MNIGFLFSHLEIAMNIEFSVSIKFVKNLRNEGVLYRDGFKSLKQAQGWAMKKILELEEYNKIKEVQILTEIRDWY